VRVTKIADGLAAVHLVELEVCARAAAFGLRMLQGAMCRLLNGARVKFRNSNGKVHRALPQKDPPFYPISLSVEQSRYLRPVDPFRFSVILRMTVETQESNLTGGGGV
jgi:hypothetical protein